VQVELGSSHISVEKKADLAASRSTRLCRTDSDPHRRPPSKMYAQRLAQRRLATVHWAAALRVQRFRRLTTVSPPPETPQPSPSSKPYRYEKAEPERSWVVQKIRANPVALKIVRALGRAMGYGSTKQVAGRRTLAMYEQVCAIKASEDRVFWQGEYPVGTRLLPHGLTPVHLSL
jgi:hypothetical protein